MNSRFKVVITDHRFPNIDSERQVLSEVGAEVIVSEAKNDEELIELVKDADGILNARLKINPKVIESMERCKVMVRYGIGVDTIDIESATKKGIMVCNVPDYCIDEVANHALALILCLGRKIMLSSRQVLAGEWSIASLKPLKRFTEQTIGIVGFGRIGRNLANKAKHLGFKIIAFDPYVGENILVDDVQMVSLEKLIRESDYISLHAPLVSENKGMIGKKQLDIMKKDAYLINVSRGPLIDELALIEALENKKIAGAGLDVLVDEPPHRDNPLLKLDNVLITPHSAWYSDEAIAELQLKAAKTVAAVLSGDIPNSVLNKEVIK
ncbi:MAG: D-3-phosphoglycerate dehydrogenase [Firmicutes bacterium]|nr:D-3-phosphoglycerate dehydrogenase [Bacillota bacterium]